MSTFCGALLCGGRSSRMGRDKAFLEVDRQPLWRLQLAKLRAVCGKVVVCGSTSQRRFFEPEGVRFEADAAADLGPLSGIARALEAAQATHALVLAVDAEPAALVALVDALEALVAALVAALAWPAAALAGASAA